MLRVVGTNLTIFKREPTTPNMSQHIATRWPNAPNMLRPTMLRYVALACCDRLAGALHKRTYQNIGISGFHPGHGKISQCFAYRVQVFFSNLDCLLFIIRYVIGNYQILNNYWMGFL